MRRAADRNLVGAPLPVAFEAELLRELRPMVAQVRQALTAIETPADARQLGEALRKRWPSKRIRRIVEVVGRKAEARSSRG